jgi:ADP-ribose pyrophosphatase YjhB (NUDIX family)
MEKQILSLFLTNKKLRFNEIEKSLKIRSNKLDYYIKKLINKKILEKKNEFYQLNEDSELLIPYISDKSALLPVVLICIKNSKKEIFLYKRKKRPYQGFLGLPGGRILVGESIEESVKRIMKTKHSINANLEKINSVSIEHLKKKNKIINSFLLIFTTAKTKERIDFTDIEKNKKEIIKSDYDLIKKDRTKSVNINIINSKLFD